MGGAIQNPPIFKTSNAFWVRLYRGLTLAAAYFKKYVFLIFIASANKVFNSAMKPFMRFSCQLLARQVRLVADKRAEERARAERCVARWK